MYCPTKKSLVFKKQDGETKTLIYVRKLQKTV